MRCMSTKQTRSLNEVRVAACPVCDQEVLVEQERNWDGEPMTVLTEHRLDTRPSVWCEGSGANVVTSANQVEQQT